MNKRTDLGDLATCCAPGCASTPNPLAPFPLCAKHLRQTYEFSISIVDQRWTDAMQMLAEDAPEPGPTGVDAFMLKPGSVYFISKDGLIKIGWSAQLRKRFYVLQPDEVLLTVKGTMADEHALHAMFTHLLHHGREWFRPEPDLLDFIANLKAQAA